MCGSEDSKEVHGTSLHLGREEEGMSRGTMWRFLLYLWDSAARQPYGCPGAAPLCVLLQTGIPRFYSWLVNSPMGRKRKSPYSGQKALWLKGCIFYYL